MTAAKRRTSRPQTFTAWQRGRFTGAIQGPVRILHGEITRLGIAWQWDHRAGCYLVPLERVDDLLASLEQVGHHTDHRTTLW